MQNRHEKEIAYISGAITSDLEYKKKFANAQTVLEELGYAVLSPLMIPPILTYDEHMNIDIPMVLAADTLCLFADWKESGGAPVERDLAMKNGKRIIYYKGVDTEPPRW